MSITPQLIWQNWVTLSGTTVTTSSSNGSFPKNWLKDPLSSKRWRSNPGWNIVAGYNDKLDIDEGSAGVATATLSVGNYATGALMAIELQTKINLAATDNTYTVTYSSTTFKFTIARATGSATIGLEWNTGASTATTVGLDIGFDTSADDTGSTTYTSDTVSYCSTEYIQFNFNTALDSKLGILFDNNFFSPTLSLHGNATDVWSSPSTTQTLTGDSSIYIKYFASTETFQYWRFVINDVTNPDGFTEVGIPYIGDYSEPGSGFSTPFTEQFMELSHVGIADHGAGFQFEKPSAKHLRLRWPGLNDNEKAKIVAAADFLKVGRPFFFSIDPQNDPTDTLYVRMTGGIQITHQPPSNWQISMEFEEALG